MGEQAGARERRAGGGWMKIERRTGGQVGELVGGGVGGQPGSQAVGWTSDRAGDGVGGRRQIGGLTGRHASGLGGRRVVKYF